MLESGLPKRTSTSSPGLKFALGAKPRSAVPSPEYVPKSRPVCEPQTVKLLEFKAFMALGKPAVMFAAAATTCEFAVGPTLEIGVVFTRYASGLATEPALRAAQVGVPERLPPLSVAMLALKAVARARIAAAPTASCPSTLCVTRLTESETTSNIIENEHGFWLALESCRPVPISVMALALRPLGLTLKAWAEN